MSHWAMLVLMVAVAGEVMATIAPVASAGVAMVEVAGMAPG